MAQVLIDAKPIIFNILDDVIWGVSLVGIDFLTNKDETFQENDLRKHLKTPKGTYITYVTCVGLLAF